jgi:hypothetical protein
MKPIFIGKNEDEQKVFLGDEEFLTHLHGIGASRTGKSKLIECIARQLITNRQGFCLIDPHGFLYDDMVRWLAYVGIKRDIILFEPASERRVVGFNPFHQTNRGDLNILVDRRVQATIKAWGATNTDATPRLERWLRCLYWALLEQGYSIDLAMYFLSWQEKEIREHLTSVIRSEVVRSEWNELAAVRNVQEFWSQIESTKNRLLFRFLEAKQVRRAMSLGFNNIDLEDIIENGKILLVNLQPKKNRLSADNARLTGTLLLNDIWEVVEKREQREGGKPPLPYYLIIDEFQKFLTPDIPEMLNSAKYGIHLLLFHQHLAQLKDLDPAAYAAVMGNARIKLIFGGLERDDAMTMVKNIFPGQIDLKRVKFLVEQTKFWPIYTRDKVYTRSTSRGEIHMSLTGGSESTQSWDGEVTPGESFTENWSDAIGGNLTETEGEADIPVTKTVPFKEVSSITPYSLDETLWELTDRLIEQYQRHFFVRIPGRPTKAAVTPFVKSWYVKPERIEEYKDSLLKNFLTPAEVDRAIFKIHNDLAIEVKGRPLLADPHGEIIIPEIPRPEGVSVDDDDDESQFGR